MKVLYVIDWAGISGGAEMVVMNSIISLPGEKHLAYFWRQNEFNDADYPGISFWNIGVIPSLITLPVAIKKVRKIIRDQEIDIVYSHLFWSNLIARLSTPSRIKLFTCIHNIGTKSSLRSWYLRWLENITYRRLETTFCVSNEVVKDYRSIVKRANAVVLYNCINDNFFKKNKNYLPFKKEKLRLISIGNSKPEKNYGYLIKVFELFKQKGINHIGLDVFGSGSLLHKYQSLSKSLEINIHFLGENFSLDTIITGYDAFILSSLSEGFGLATVEAMASHIPVFLSDIPVNREVTAGNAVFFNLDDPTDAAEKLIRFSAGQMDLGSFVEQAHARALEIAQKEKYIAKLMYHFTK